MSRCLPATRQAGVYSATAATRFGFGNAVRARYHNHGGFVFAWTIATLKSAQAGFIRPIDAFNLLVAGARAATCSEPSRRTRPKISA